ncbi:uncharacterized protein J7T54_000732 [Emericellopsis cladophorae]|uniref:Uncharacterized protein n=1 Tax=Emericellopsis cladophorae TaxID=2686198 RepID=A0A9Q0BG17_9HYPO|nr:uncharacterized protein J7T54_000732 [Emericellopsis cladophorae]KAI6783230.1 hypothetical protein J7T54_000732 [Emericellopsis cladophorae]
MPTEAEVRIRRDSWPPTQMWLETPRNRKVNEPRPLLDDMDDDPLTYFLTPTPDDVGVDYGTDFDAGIEDPNHPAEMVRSVSPSTLEGLSKPDRPSSPECDSGMTSPDEHDGDDDDEEDYIHWSPLNSRLTSFKDLHIDGLSLAKSPSFGRSANALLSQHSFPAPTPRGRSRGGGQRSSSPSLRPGHLWRVPSPDVWSIEEETEEELRDAQQPDTPAEKKTKVSGKPKKKVRFILPPRD